MRQDHLAQEVFPLRVGDELQVVVVVPADGAAQRRQIDRQARGPRIRRTGEEVQHGGAQRGVHSASGTGDGWSSRGRHTGHEVAQVAEVGIGERQRSIAGGLDGGPVGRRGRGEHQVGKILQYARQARARAAHLGQVHRREDVAEVARLVSIHDVAAQGGGVHGGIRHQVVEEPLILPTVPGLGLLTSSQHLRVVANLIGNLRHPHQAGIEPNQFNVGDAGHRRGDVGHAEGVTAAGVVPADAVKPAAVIPIDQPVVARGILRHAPLDEIDHAGRMAHVDLADIGAPSGVGHVCELDQTAPGAGPVSVPGVVTRDAVELDHDIHVGGRADTGHFQKVVNPRALQVIVTVQIDHERPTVARAANGTEHALSTADVLSRIELFVGLGVEVGIAGNHEAVIGAIARHPGKVGVGSAVGGRVDVVVDHLIEVGRGHARRLKCGRAGETERTIGATANGPRP